MSTKNILMIYGHLQSNRMVALPPYMMTSEAIVEVDTYDKILAYRRR
jgi:hypothetical protein